jgi:NADP-dependent 3-hydroxy acid dehydrogenase YdfG
MSAGVAGRRIVVTGASSGIGHALVRELVAAGAQVIAMARSDDALRALASALGPSVIPVAGDVRLADDVERLVGSAGAADAVINNAGIGRVEPFLASDAAGWREILDTNLVGALLVARAFLPAMLAARRGVIINVGSAAADGWPYLAAYAASKAALRAASAALASEYGGRGVCVEYVEIGPTAGTEFGARSDPAHLPIAARAWTELGIPWRTDVATPDTAARALRAALERRLPS